MSTTKKMLFENLKKVLWPNLFLFSYLNSDLGIRDFHLVQYKKFNSVFILPKVTKSELYTVG